MAKTARKPARLRAPLLERKTPFRRKLLKWYRREARELPFRGETDPYKVWVSEIILQQTRVDQGTPYINRFLKSFPTVRDLARADLDEVLKLWEGLGYYSRARNLHKAARIVISDVGGRLPANAKDWEDLPGVGRYTAGAIASIALGEKVPVLDGNVKRVLARLLDLDASIDEGPTLRLLWDAMGHLVQGRAPGDFNQAMMELGARVCTPKSPDCTACPVRTDCKARLAGTQQLRPVRSKKRPVPHHEIVVAAIKKNGRYLLGKRPPKGLLGGLWEFPGGKLERGESHGAAVIREVKEELGITVQPGALVASVDHAYSHFRVTLNVYACRHVSGTPSANAHTELKWVRPSEFKKLAFPKANHKFMHLL